MPATSLQALSRVLEYREANPWKLNPTHSTLPTFEVQFFHFGKHYQIVDLYDALENPPTSLGCFGESYRYDQRNGEVLPFDNCVEGRNRLPTLWQLPTSP